MGEQIKYTQPEEPKEERNVERWSMCQMMCSEDEKCNFWSYNQKERTCLMMKSFGREEGDRETTSGPKKCYDCQEESTAFEADRDEQPREERNVERWSDCQKMCMKDERCNFWTYDERAETCLMIKDFGREEKKQGSISGVKKCPIYDCQEEGIVYDRPVEPKEERLEGGNWKQCQKMCRDDERCNVYDCYNEGTEVQFADAIDPKEERNVESWSECQKMCSKDEKCNFWSYNGRSETCMMMRAQMRLSKAEGAFSGPKECTDRIAL